MKEILGSFINDELTHLVAYDTNIVPKPSQSFTRVLQRASIAKNATGDNSYIETCDVLLSITSELNSQANYFLTHENVDKYSIKKFLEDKKQTKEGDSEGKKRKISIPYCSELTSMTHIESLDPIIGRDQDVEKICKALMRKKKNNIILRADAGVGKTTIIDELARKISTDEVHDSLKGSSVWSLDVSEIMAGTKYRGELEQRVQEVLKKLQEVDQNNILFIDEIHNIVGSGNTSSGGMDIMNMLKPALTKNLKCIGATTFEEYKGTLQKNMANTRRFKLLDVKEPSKEDTIQIIKGLKAKFEEHHKVVLDEDYIETVVDLADKYMVSRTFPDKAIDILDDSCVAARSKSQEHVSLDDIYEVVSDLTSVPLTTISSSEIDIIRNLEKNISSKIYGQDQAVSKMTRVIKRHKAGLTDDNKPIGSFIFAGPTGVGKTELCKITAEEMSLKLLRFDMSEYDHESSISKLIGTSAGFIGYEDGGLLTTEVTKNPYSLILLDEFEKAHPKIQNLLLQIADNGFMKDNQGNLVDFRNTLLVLTTNTGIVESQKNSIGFGSVTNEEEVINDSLNAFFSPEFRNRLDAVIQFNYLTKQNYQHITNKFMSNLSDKLKAKDITLEIEEEVNQFIIDNSFDKSMGARPIKRYIYENVEEELVDKIIFDEPSSIKISIKNGVISFDE